MKPFIPVSKTDRVYHTNRILEMVLLLCILFSSCKRSSVAESGIVPSGAEAAAVLQAGVYPLWFQLGSQGPFLLDSIEEAAFSAALIPWPLAPHIRFMLAADNEVLMVVNGDGFLRFAPWQGKPKANEEAGRDETGLYRFSGGEYWSPYTVASFVFYDDKPMALLYRDDRFLDSDAGLPPQRVWTFNAETPDPYAIDIPAFRRFSSGEGWDVDALRYSTNGFWHYRVINKEQISGDILFFRSSDLSLEGEEIPLSTFQNSALPEPLFSAPQLLQTALASLDSFAAGTVQIVSPAYNTQRYFAHNGGGLVNILAWYRSGTESSEVVVIDLKGRGLYGRGKAENESSVDSKTAPAESSIVTPVFFPIALPELPENFVYTGIAMSGQTLMAAWEEQEDYCIGAAGFMALRLAESAGRID